MCLVVFQKIFRKKFSGVWKRRRKTQATTQKKKKIINDENVSSPTTARSTARSRGEIAIDGAIEISPSSRDHDRRRDRNLREIAIDEAISRRSRSRLRDLGLELEQAISDWIFSSCARARALSLSLSHFLEML